MLRNDQMRENKYGRWALAKKLYYRIQDTFQARGIVTVATCTQAQHYDARHRFLFTYDMTGVYVQRGKHKECISLCGFRFTLPA